MNKNYLDIFLWKTKTKWTINYSITTKYNKNVCKQCNACNYTLYNKNVCKYNIFFLIKIKKYNDSKIILPSILCNYS